MYYINTKFLLITILVSAGLFLTACSNGESKSNPTKPATATTHTAQADTGKPAFKNAPEAPNFTLKTMDGDTFTLSEHRGQVIVLNFWATWCPPCRKEIPGFIKIQKEMRDKGVLFVGVSLDKKGWSVVRPFAKKYGINYPIMVDNGTATRKYGPFRGVPTTFIITKKGKIAYGGAGMIPVKALRPVLEKLVNR